MARKPRLNRDGQPESRAFNWHRVGESRMDELIGVCRGILADGCLVEQEARYLHEWFLRNDPVRCSPMGKRLFSVLRENLGAEGMNPDAEERIVVAISSFIGGLPSVSDDSSHSTRVPLDDPPPVILFNGCGFCFTGKFAFGSRRVCQSATVQAGGNVHENLVQGTSFLVIGDIGSRDWKHSTHGLKIERALELKDGGFPIAIVDELHWAGAIRKILSG